MVPHRGDRKIKQLAVIVSIPVDRFVRVERSEHPQMCVYFVIGKVIEGHVDGVVLDADRGRLRCLLHTDSIHRAVKLNDRLTHVRLRVEPVSLG